MTATVFSFGRKLLYVTSTATILLLVTLLIGEVVIRLTNVPVGAPYNGKEKDKLLGWKTKAFYTYHTSDFSDNKGGKYEVNLNFKQHGFRTWGETAFDSTIGNLFVLGDSYVESIEV
jgi:hypothetical protein